MARSEEVSNLFSLKWPIGGNYPVGARKKSFQLIQPVENCQPSESGDMLEGSIQFLPMYFFQSSFIGKPHHYLSHRIGDSQQFSAPAPGYFFHTTDDYKLHPFSLCSLPVSVPFSGDKRHERKV